MGLAIELFTNLFQAVMFVGFLYLFFDKPEGKLKRLLPFLGGVLAILSITCFFTFSGAHTGASSYYLDSLLSIIVFEVYTIVFLKGKWYLKIMMPLISFCINALVSYNFGFLVSVITGKSIEESLVMSTGFRYLCLAVVNLTTALLLWLILRIGSRRIRLSGMPEIISFAVIPFMCMIILYCNFFIINVSGFDANILPYLLTICIVMVIMAILTCAMLVRISKANKIKTDFLLAQQREKLYEENTIATNEQIEKISGIRHDMKNKLMSLKGLINQGDLEQALRLCDDTSEKLETTYTPINSSNPILNAIVNVELEKATSLGINFTVDITESLAHISSADTVSLIGNLCDNAIEYLSTQPKEIRKMSLQIYSQLNFRVIICKNRVTNSILSANPNLATTKEDKINHGKGTSVIKRIAKEYDGDVMYSEEEGVFIVSVIINKK